MEVVAVLVVCCCCCCFVGSSDVFQFNPFGICDCNSNFVI